MTSDSLTQLGFSLKAPNYSCLPSPSAKDASIPRLIAATKHPSPSKLLLHLAPFVCLVINSWDLGVTSSFVLLSSPNQQKVTTSSTLPLVAFPLLLLSTSQPQRCLSPPMSDFPAVHPAPALPPLSKRSSLDTGCPTVDGKMFLCPAYHLWTASSCWTIETQSLLVASLLGLCSPVLASHWCWV